MLERERECFMLARVRLLTGEIEREREREREKERDRERERKRETEKEGGRERDVEYVQNCCF
jgi:hypothetical protein